MVDPGTIIAATAAVAGAKPAATLIECISRGIGAVAEPALLRRKSKAEREAELAQARLEMQIERERNIHERGMSQIRAEAAARQEMESVEKEINLQQVLACALEKVDPAAVAVAIDRQWLHAFKEAAEAAFDDEIQDLWARVLAGQFSQPGRFSVRTIHALKQTSLRESQIMSQFCQISFDAIAEWYIPRDCPLVYERIKHFDLAHLESIGFLSFDGAYRPGDSAMLAMFGNKVVKLHDLRRDREGFFLNKISTTQVGTEIASLVELDKDYDFLQRIIKSPSPIASIIEYIGDVNDADPNAPLSRPPAGG